MAQSLFRVSRLIHCGLVWCASHKHWSQVKFTGEQSWRFICILPSLAGSGSGMMTNQVRTDPHPAVGALPTPPSSLGPPSVFVLKVEGTHTSWMETSWYFWCISFPMSPVVEKNKLLPRSCLFPSDFIAKGHNRTEPSRTHALMGELRHKGIVIFLTS